jgi:hypothetical protein
VAALQVGRWQHSTRGLATPSGQYDAVVIGGGAFVLVLRTRIRLTISFSAGPGGYVAAIKAAQLGLKVRRLSSPLAQVNLALISIRPRV